MKLILIVVKVIQLILACIHLFCFFQDIINLPKLIILVKVGVNEGQQLFLSEHGYNYYYWVTSTGSTSTPSSYVDSFCPGYIVPKDGTVKAYTIIGNISTTDTWEWMLTKGAAPTYGSAGNYSVSQIGTTQSAGCTANILYKWEQTGLSVAMNKNDMALPVFRRTTDDDSSYSYCEFSMHITLE